MPSRRGHVSDSQVCHVGRPHRVPAYLQAGRIHHRGKCSVINLYRVRLQLTILCHYLLNTLGDRD